MTAQHAQQENNTVTLRLVSTTIQPNMNNTSKHLQHVTTKPINRRPAVVEHSPVTYIRTQLTTSQTRGQMLESSIEFDLVEHWFIPKTRKTLISTDKQPSIILQHFDRNFAIISEP